MTISEYIISFLKLCKTIDIETNHVQDGSDKYGLFKSPGRDVQQFIDETYRITENYQFIAKQNCTSSYDRVDSDQWLEDVTYWVDDYPWEHDYPSLGTNDNRTVEMIELTGCPYPMETDGKEALYQMSLSITYLRKRG